MSAFIVRSETIDCILGKLKELYSDSYDKWILDEFIKEAEFGENVYSEQGLNLQMIGEALYAMNSESVSQRYDEPQTIIPFIAKPFIVSDVQVIKALSCLSYQSCEGNVVDTKIYKAMENLHNRLAMVYVQNLKEWDEADWDVKEERRT